MRACAKRQRAPVVAALRTATEDCHAELAQIGPAAFIEEWGDEPTDPLDYAMSECIAEGTDEILNPEDYVDDDPDEAEDA